MPRKPKQKTPDPMPYITGAEATQADIDRAVARGDTATLARWVAEAQVSTALSDADANHEATIALQDIQDYVEDALEDFALPGVEPMPAPMPMAYFDFAKAPDVIDPLLCLLRAHGQRWEDAANDARTVITTAAQTVSTLEDEGFITSEVAAILRVALGEEP